MRHTPPPQASARHTVASLEKYPATAVWQPLRVPLTSPDAGLLDWNKGSTVYQLVLMFCVQSANRRKAVVAVRSPGDARANGTRKPVQIPIKMAEDIQARQTASIDSNCRHSFFRCARRQAAQNCIDTAEPREQVKEIQRKRARMPDIGAKTSRQATATPSKPTHTLS
jgi:hypothetical protein